MSTSQVFILAGVLFIAGLIILGNAKWLGANADDTGTEGDHNSGTAVKSMAGSIVLLVVVAIAAGFFVKGLTLLSGS